MFGFAHSDALQVLGSCLLNHLLWFSTSIASAPAPGSPQGNLSSASSLSSSLCTRYMLCLVAPQCPVKQVARPLCPDEETEALRGPATARLGSSEQSWDPAFWALSLHQTLDTSPVAQKQLLWMPGISPASYKLLLTHAAMMSSWVASSCLTV